tara:strand:- start:47 stop:424 length:378 start_codon:yes stop_codon:yes gene_type:complete
MIINKILSLLDKPIYKKIFSGKKCDTCKIYKLFIAERLQDNWHFKAGYTDSCIKCINIKVKKKLQERPKLRLDGLKEERPKLRLDELKELNEKGVWYHLSTNSRIIRYRKNLDDKDFPTDQWASK